MANKPYKGFTVQGQITSVKPLMGDIFSITTHTEVITQDEARLQLMKSLGKEGHFLFKENEIQPEEIPSGEAEVKGKTPSQRFYNVLFSLWKQGIIGEGMEWRTFYESEFEKIIEHYKTKFI